MAVLQLMLPANRAFSSDGAPIAGAVAYLYSTGTLTPATFYADDDLVIPLGTSITANAAGRFPTAYQNGDTPFRLIIKDENGVTLDDIDPFYFGQVYGSSIPPVATRTALAAITGSANTMRYLTESGREGEFVWSSANHSADVTNDPSQGVFVPPSSAPTGASGAWVRNARVLSPKMFGAAANGSTNDAAALNAFLAFAALYRNYKYSMAGDYAIASGLTLDAGTYGDDPTFEIDFGQCRITATATMDRLFTVKDCFGGKFSGRLALRGVNHTVDSNASWTCATGLYLDNCSNSVFDDVWGQGLGYATVEEEKNPSANNTCKFGHISGKRVASGWSTSAKTANWSGRTDAGGYGTPYTVQYSEFTVDTLPNTYLQTTSGSPSYVPSHNVYVEISGRLHFVGYMNGNTLRVYPALKASLGASGTLKYHYGAAFVSVGNDSNINTVNLITAVGCGGAAEISSLYGPSVNMIHAEGCGSAIKVGANPSATLVSGHVGVLYCEGNIFNIVTVGTSITDFFIGSRANEQTPSKDVDLSNNAPLSAAETYSPGRMDGYTIGSGGRGLTYMRNRYPFGISSSHNIDFNKPYTFEAPTYVTYYFLDTIDFNLIAPDNILVDQFGYDTTMIGVMGRGTDGKVAGGSINFTPPAGHTINGGAAGAAATFTTASMSGPTIFMIAYTAASTWLIYPVKSNVSNGDKGDITVSGVGDVWTVDNDAITYAKMQNVSAAERLLGRGDSGSGDPQELTLGSNLDITGTALDLAATIAPTTVSATGAIKSSGATAGVGYATGAGGAVTQLTDKSTGVTLNTVSGQITMHNASLAASTSVSFTLTNSAIAATDVVVVNIGSGATANSYAVTVDSVAAGSCRIQLRNVSAGALGEAVVLNFAVIKAVNA